MIVITVARKPLEGTVVSTVIRWGTGGLNIDGCRIDGVPPSVPQWFRGDGNAPFEADGRNGVMSQPSLLGRWPSNLILQHCPECACVGTIRLRSSDRPGHGESKSTSELFFGPQTLKHSQVQHGDSDGKETVAVWECVRGCPVLELGGQSGTLHNGGGNDGKDRQRRDPVQWSTSQPTRYAGETGTAARFFKQVKE